MGGQATLTLNVMLEGSPGNADLGESINTGFESDIAQIASGNDDPGGGSIDPEFECDVGGITSGNADPGWGIN